MIIVSDLHIHSRFSRATSGDMEVDTLAVWARKKGINLLGTGDFTHPTYLSLLKSRLEEAEYGLYRLKGGSDDLRFILTAEVSNIFSQAGRVRRVHSLIIAPTFDVVDRINRLLARRGNLLADGRPTFGFSARELLQMVLGVSEECLIIPAHAWTPWYSVFGSSSGFDSLEECFGDDARYIYAIETGLSSDPAMNWRLSSLDGVTLVSNSDAHSPSRIGREANVFRCSMDYREIVGIIREKDRKRFLYTIEFFPEEGKYHFDGHRGCNVVLSPKESMGMGNICPSCGKALTIGVLHRVEALSDREDGFVPEGAIPFKKLIPLDEIIAEALDCGANTKRVTELYESMVSKAPELDILINLPPSELRTFVPEKVVEGILKVREGRVTIRPGYDGVYGEVRIFGDEEERQLGLF